MSRNHKRLLIIFFIIGIFSLAGGLLFLAGCHEGPKAEAEFYNIRKIELRAIDQKHIIELARAYSNGQSPARDEDRYPIIYNKEERGVFVTAVRPNQPALTAFSWGDTIDEATKAAAKLLKRMATSEDLNKLKLRIDVIDESTGEKQRQIEEKWSIDVSNQGIIFKTDPRAAFLGQELRDWGVIGKKGEYNHKQMKKLIRHRNLGRVLDEQLAPKQKIQYTRFSTISFLETDGDPMPLLRGNRTTNFDPTPERILQAINAAGNYLKNAVKPSGEFEYLYYPQTHHWSKEYNQLRHAGTTFAMAQIYQINKDPDLLAAIKRALQYLDKSSLGPNPQDINRYNWRAVFEPNGRYAKTGGSGLALLAFSTYTQATGDKQYLPLMEAYARFIDYMLEPNGDLKMRYWSKEEDQDKDVKDVLYYPGECFFGLSRLYHVDPNPKYVETAERGIDYVADVRDAKVETAKLEPDHWMLYAISEFYQIKPKENELKHAKRVLEAMMGRFIFKSEYPDFVGGFMSKPHSTTTACRLEGTAAMCKLFKKLGDQEQAARLTEALKLGAGFLMRNQYDNINTMFFQNPDKAIGGYMESYWNPEIEIDYVQHCTSALVSIREILMGGN